MGFYIQDDYYNEAVSTFSNERDQDRFWGMLIRYYFTGDVHQDSAKAPVKAAFNMTKARIDKARSEADRKRNKRSELSGQSADSPRTFRGRSANYPSKNQESEKEREKEREKVDVDVYTDLQVYEGGEIVAEPEGFAHFMAECVRLYNAATGQAYSFPDARARQGMLEIFRAGRTIEDVERVMADVKSWPRNYQTLDGVFADGKFEKHINREASGGEHRDWSQYNYLMR